MEIQHTGYDEQEKRTPIAGYVLLIAMFVASVFFGWRALDDLQNVPARPELLSHCAAPFLSFTWEDYGRGYESNFRDISYGSVPVGLEPRIAYKSPVPAGDVPQEQCVFSGIEAKYNIPSIFEGRKAKDLELSNIELQLQQVEINLSDYERQYQLGLTEQLTAEQRRLYDIPTLQAKITDLRKQNTDFQIRRDLIMADLKPIDDQLKNTYQNLLVEYRGEWRWYELWVFLLEILFVVPFFALVFWGYRKLFERNSPYTIIATPLIGVASVLLLRVLIGWFWSLFLARVIENVWNLVKNIALLKSLIFYGGMVLSIIIFGGAVYLLQKRIFDPKRVSARRLRDKLCPSCQASLDLANEYCPNCGRKLKIMCAKCGKERWMDLPFCPHCRNEN